MSNSIKNWALNDRPREKMVKVGKKSMTNAELLAIILGSGSKDQSAVKLARTVLMQYDNDPLRLSVLSVNDLCHFNGIGPAKAISIISAIELGKRTCVGLIPEKAKIITSENAYIQVKEDLESLPHEEFWMLILNRGNRVLQKKQISKGGIAGTIADVRLIFKEVIEHRGSAIIVAHNHPSGNANPSKADLKLTHKIKEAGKILDIELLDHLIVVQGSYLSFADEGIL